MVKGFVEDRNKHDFINHHFQECNRERRQYGEKPYRTLYSYYKNNYTWLNRKWLLEKSQWLSRGEIS